MTVTPLSRVLATESDHIVCFDRQGRELRWQDFVTLVASLSASLADTESRHWALDISDTFEFGCALFACWSAEKTPVLAPEHMVADPDSELNIDGIISSTARQNESRPIIAIDQLAKSNLLDGVIATSSDLVLFTSGSTGQPMQIRRTIRHFEAELDVLESVFGQKMGDCSVYSTVSHRHVYGLLFRLLWPLVTGRSFANYDFEFPESLLSDCGTDAALVSSPALLKRIGHLKDKAGTDWRVVFSSGGLLPEYAAKDALSLLGVWPVEVLGSTETSGVAWRIQQDRGAATLWHTLPEVRVRQDEDEFLEVSSPFTGLSGWHRMGDKVRLETLRSFELLGRGDHIVKIEDRRVSLAEIEQNLTKHDWVSDAAAVAFDEGGRQYIGVVLELSELGRAEIESSGRKELNRQLKEWLRDKSDPLALPRKFRYEDEIPVNPQGKRQQAVIRQLFDAQ